MPNWSPRSSAAAPATSQAQQRPSAPSSARLAPARLALDGRRPRFIWATASPSNPSSLTVTAGMTLLKHRCYLDPPQANTLSCLRDEARVPGVAQGTPQSPLARTFPAAATTLILSSEASRQPCPFQPPTPLHAFKMLFPLLEISSNPVLKKTKFGSSIQTRLCGEETYPT